MIKAPESILTIWKKFDDFPMETLTKAWLIHSRRERKQRVVSQMKEHRIQYGITGNCFDLALWLLDEFRKAGATAYPIGHNLHTPSAHAAIIVLDELGRRYLCDLGDQWLQPILIETTSEDFTEESLNGFFPAAKVQVKADASHIKIIYHRPNGRVSKQIYETRPIEVSEFLTAAQFSHNILKPRPLLECRTRYKNEVAHWEFYNWKSFLSTTEGIFHDPKLDTLDHCVNILHEKTGYDQTFLKEALTIYQRIG
ncbi:hypothetical protein H1D32_05815 [Anaerobacillus sp. CMMVII]|uniref:hypothetical protein n=1 Tax=Anaerobacillus sp. CMMVII TaxID=2755588 RepID=UPI0021B82870|nr:hypothetical protein [Anaerobacillus sp. CMMVII]MCT8137302.1 hypothetical protein [Anaerobacillus sp. CMMVII]